MRRMFRVAIAASAACLIAGIAQAQETKETFAAGTSGSAVYQTYCAVCHGVGARGDGPLAENLRVAPSDLTLLAKRNGGKFDAVHVHRLIDGRDPVKGHGGSDMPVWGDAFKRSSEGHSEQAVKERIDALVEHLRAVQRQ